MSSYDQLLEQHKMVHPECREDYTKIPVDILYPYNGDDCIATRRLFFKQRKLLKEQGLWKKPFQFPLMWIAWIAMMMQINGMNASEDRNRELDKIYRSRIEKLDYRLYHYPEVKQLQREQDDELLAELYGRVKSYKRPVPNVRKKVFQLFRNNTEPVNLNSPEVKRKLLFDIFEYESLEETKSGLPSVKRWVIEDLQQKHKNPILKDIIKRSEYSSAHSKVILPVIPDWIGSDGRVHSSHLPHGTRTGRMSSQDPNLYNLPARSPLTPELMSQFVPRNENFVILKQDSKQIELRLIADRAKDKNMIAEFRAGKDPHAKAAQAVYGYTEKQWAKLKDYIRKKLRSICKNAISFGVIYGRLAAAVAADFGWSLRRAQEFIDGYFGHYYGIKAYLESETERIAKECVSISHYNRHRRLPEANSEDIGRANHAIREGINAPIQGDASDINTIAAYRMQHWLMKHKMKTKVINYVYDAVYLDVHRKELEIVTPKLHFFMTDRKFLLEKVGWKLNVPLDTDCAIGDKNMGDMIELEHTKIPGQFVIPKHLLQN
jgi:DNA polymerase-1